MTTPEVQFRSDFTVETIGTLGDDQTPLKAARVSTKGAGSRTTEENSGLRNYLIREGHHVPFEHTAITFYIEAPIFATRQILKHRVSSISETSGRYRELEPVFYIPPHNRPVKQIGKTGDYEFEMDYVLASIADREIKASAELAWDCYRAMLDGGIAKEVARLALPMTTYSSMYVTMNSRALFNFFKLRRSKDGSHPQWEIEQIADLMYEQWKDAFPKTVSAWEG